MCFTDLATDRPKGVVLCEHPRRICGVKSARKAVGKTYAASQEAHSGHKAMSRLACKQAWSSAKDPVELLVSFWECLYEEQGAPDVSYALASFRCAPGACCSDAASHNGPDVDEGRLAPPR